MRSCNVVYAPKLLRCFLFTLFALFALVACAGPAAAGGSATASVAQPAAASAGDEAPPDKKRPGGVEPAPASAQRGSIIVTARVAGTPVASHVQVLDLPAPLEAEGGESISLPEGNQRIAVTVADKSALLDTPTQNLSVFVLPGKLTPIDVPFAWAKVRLDVLVQGRSHGGVPVKLLRDGVPVAELESGQAPQAISPGRYEADVLLRGRTIHVTGLVFLKAAEQTVPVRAQF